MCSAEDPVQLECVLPAGGDRWIRAHQQRSLTGQGETKRAPPALSREADTKVIDWPLEAGCKRESIP